MQKERKLKEAKAEYQRLFNLDLLRLSYESGLPPAAYKLKYLACKNHGVLLLDELKEDLPSISDEQDVVDRIGYAIDDFCEALDYNDEDSDFLELLYALATALGYDRMGRLALESVLSSETRPLDLFKVPKRLSALSPRDVEILLELRSLLSRIGDNSTLNGVPLLAKLARTESRLALRRQSPSFDWIPASVVEPETLRGLVRSIEKQKLEITITRSDWWDIMNSLNEEVSSLTKVARKKLETDDPYWHVEDPIVVVKFIDLFSKVSQSDRIESAAETPRTIEAGPQPSTPVSAKTAENENAKPIETVGADPGEDSKEKTAEPTEETPQDMEVDEPEGDGPTGGEQGTPRKKLKRSAENGNGLHRSSKRFRNSDIMGGVDSALDDSFFDQVDAFVSLAGMKFESVVPIFVEGNYAPEEQYIYDFSQALRNWDDDQAEVFLALDDLGTNSNKNANKSTDRGERAKGDRSIMQVLDQAALQSKDIVRPAFESQAEDIVAFINRVNDGRLHLQQVRVLLLEVLLTSSVKASGVRYFSLLEDYWPKPLCMSTHRLVELCDGSLHEHVKGAIFSGAQCDTARVLRCAELACAVFEIFADLYLTAEKQYRSAMEDGKSSKISAAQLRDLEFRVGSLKSRVLRWQGTFCDLACVYPGEPSDLQELSLRHEWVSIFCGGVYDLGPEESLARYESLHKELLHLPDLLVPFHNYACIPELSVNGCSTQISKYRAGSIFAKIFHREEDENGWSRIELLEAILLQDDASSSKDLPEKEAISQFLSTASLEFKLKLWHLLLDAYNENGDTEKSLNGYLRILVSSIDEITGDRYREKSESQRMGLLLRSLNVCLDINRSVLKILREHAALLENLTLDRRLFLTKKLVMVLRMLHMYVLLDDSINNNVIQSPSHPSWDKASGQLKQLLLFSWSVFYFLFKSCLPEDKKHSPDIQNDILSIIHEELGTRGYCGIADGVFLDMCIEELIRLDWEQSEADMLQCLHCKYGLSIMNEGGFMPYNHHSTPENLDKGAASRLVKFFLGMVLRKKNFHATLNRNDIKTALDEFSAALGKPDNSIVSIRQNAQLLDGFLDMPVTTALLQTAFKGQLSLSLARVRDSASEAMRKFGFYYILGHNLLNQFRTRKRSGGTTRMEDVEKILGYFIDDLCLNSNRFESWMGVSQAYDIMAEEGMSYNAESFATADARKKIGNNQRKAILACCMAASIYLQDKTAWPADMLTEAHYQQVASGLWVHFAKLLYGAIRPPMKREALLHISEMYYTDEQGVSTRAARKPMRDSAVLKMAQLACALAASSERNNDWFPALLYAKILKKLSRPPTEVLDQTVKAIDASSGSNEALEPHYKLVSLAFKYARAGKLPFDDALAYLERSLFHQRVFGPHRNSEEQFYAEAAETLQRIRQGDKRKWQHRPTYRLARLYDDAYGDRARARSLMSHFCSLGRTSTKPLVQIWKPDHERPGVHFEFAYRYVMYMIDLVVADKDTETLGIIAKKLRRFSTGIVLHMEAWEHLCLSTARVARELTGIPEQVHGSKYSDYVIRSLSFDDFDKYSTKLHDRVQAAGDGDHIPDLVTSLDFAVELRRLNNGFGSTSVVDDTLVSIYLRLLKDFMAKEQKREEAEKVKTESVTDQTPSTPASTENGNPAQDPKEAPKDLNRDGAAPKDAQKDAKPKAEKGKAKAAASPAKGVAHKNKVTRKEIIIRSTALLKAALPKLSRGDTKIVLEPSDVDPFVMPPPPPPPPEKPDKADKAEKAGTKSPSTKQPPATDGPAGKSPDATKSRYRIVPEPKQIAPVPISAVPSEVSQHQSSNPQQQAEGARIPGIMQDRRPSDGTASPGTPTMGSPSPYVASPRPLSSMSQTRQLPSPQGLGLAPSPSPTNVPLAPHPGSTPYATPQQPQLHRPGQSLSQVTPDYQQNGGYRSPYHLAPSPVPGSPRIPEQRPNQSPYQPPPGSQ